MNILFQIYILISALCVLNSVFIIFSSKVINDEDKGINIKLAISLIVYGLIPIFNIYWALFTGLYCFNGALFDEQLKEALRSNGR